MTKPLLSICIPVYNRPEYLVKAMESIVGHFKDPEVAAQVEVVMCDDGEDKSHLLEPFTGRYPTIRYIKNEQRKGFDGNVMHTVRQAQGIYCWYFGEDDLVIPGALPFLLSVLAAKEVPLMTVTGRAFSSYEELPQEPQSYSPSDAVIVPTAAAFLPYCRGILSTFIFRRDSWLAIDPAGYEKGWSYFEIVLKMLAEYQGPYVHIANPVTFMKDDCDWVAGGTELFTFTGWHKILKKLPGWGIDASAMDAMLRQFPRDLPRTIFRAKSHGLPYSFVHIRLIISEFRDSPLSVVAALVVYAIPNPLIRFLKRIVKSLHRTP